MNRHVVAVKSPRAPDYQWHAYTPLGELLGVGDLWTLKCLTLDQGLDWHHHGPPNPMTDKATAWPPLCGMLQRALCYNFSIVHAGYRKNKLIT